jgi:hypothetical protein
MDNFLIPREKLYLLFFRDSKLYAFGIIGIGLAFSISVYFLGFFYYSNNEKLVLLLALSFLFFSILFFIPPKILSTNAYFLSRFSFKQQIIGTIIIAGIALFSFLAGLPFLPTQNSFEIKILKNDLSPEKINQIEVLQIDSLGRNNLIGTTITPENISVFGNWTINKNSLSISGVGGESIHFIDNSNKGVSLLLLRSPHAGNISIDWNGNNQIINLRSETFDQVRIDFPHFFSWKNQSIIKNILVCFLVISNFTSLVFLLFFFETVYFLTQKLFKYLNRLTLLKKIIVFLILFSPIINYFAFINYQTVDSYKMDRIPSNSLIRLDKLESK